MEHKCQKCGKCCSKYDIFINLDDVERWLDQERYDIIACLTWHYIKGRNPPYMLFIPKKMHIEGHSILKKFWKPEMKGNRECIFLHNNLCRIYSTCPTACKNFPKGKLDAECPGFDKSTINKNDIRMEKLLAQERKRQNIKLYVEREMISAAIKKAKEMIGTKELAKLILDEWRDSNAGV